MTTLETLIDGKISFEKKLEAELLKIDCFFQDNIWDGYSDENDPKFISREDFYAIEALTDKIKHMILYIGCPNSVMPMIQSICTRKIKYWQGNNSLQTADVKSYFFNEETKRGFEKVTHKGFRKGKQLKRIDDVARVKKSTFLYDKGIVLKGHFRWNNRGYMLSRRATDLLANYFELH